MHSYEDRMRAVALYIKLGNSVSLCKSLGIRASDIQFAQPGASTAHPFRNVQRLVVRCDQDRQGRIHGPDRGGLGGEDIHVDVRCGQNDRQPAHRSSFRLCLSTQVNPKVS